MAPMQKKVEKKGGKKKEMITMEVKQEIIKKYKQGMRVAEIARLYKKSTSTICTILKKKEEISGIDAAKGVTRITKNRPRVLEDVEKLLLVWINEKKLAGVTVTENLICEKAKALYTDLVSKLPGMSTENEEGFKASPGWFDNFKRRSGIRSVLRHKEAASSDVKAAESFATEFQKLNSALGKLWPDCLLGHDLDGLAHEREPPVVNEFVSLGKTMELEVNKHDIQDPVVEHGQELTTDELLDLHHKQQQELMQEFLSTEQEEEKAEKSLTLNEIRKMCKTWETVQNFVEKHHPNKVVAVRAMNLFNDNAMSYFHEILKREKRVSLDKFPVKVSEKEKDSVEPMDSCDSSSEGFQRKLLHSFTGRGAC